MAGRITLDGKQIAVGTVLNFRPETPPLQVLRQKFWGVNGESELRGGRGGQKFRAHMLIHSGWSAALLNQELRALDRLIGKLHGQLVVVTDNNVYIEENVTFEGWQQMEPAEAGPLQDVAGTLDPLGNGTGGWFAEGVLHFFQVAEGGAT